MGDEGNVARQRTLHTTAKRMGMRLLIRFHFCFADFIKPIKTKADHRAALTEIKQLFHTDEQVAHPFLIGNRHLQIVTRYVII